MGKGEASCDFVNAFVTISLGKTSIETARVARKRDVIVKLEEEEFHFGMTISVSECEYLRNVVSCLSTALWMLLIVWLVAVDVCKMRPEDCLKVFSFPGGTVWLKSDGI